MKGLTIKLINRFELFIASSYSHSKDLEAQLHIHGLITIEAPIIYEVDPPSLGQ